MRFCPRAVLLVVVCVAGGCPVALTRDARVWHTHTRTRAHKQTGDVGRSSSYEVVVDDTYVAYSKLGKGAFPDFAGLAVEIDAYCKTGKVLCG